MLIKNLILAVYFVTMVATTYKMWREYDRNWKTSFWLSLVTLIGLIA